MDENKQSAFNIYDSVKGHKCLRYTTNLGALELILHNKTFRCTCLATGKLNDKKESERNGVGDYANTKYIACFSYDIHESVPFWLNYGGNRNEKVQMVFENFMSADIDRYIDTKIALTESGKVCIGEEYNNTFLSDGTEIKEKKDYVSEVYIQRIDMFDVEYKPVDDKTFSRSYLEEIDFKSTNLPWGKTMVAFPDCLGKQKTDPWEYEKEARILCTTGLNLTKYYWEWIDLQLKDEIFRNLRIITSPWDDGTQTWKIKKAIFQSQIAEDIKASIRVEKSALTGTLNFD